MKVVVMSDSHGCNREIDYVLNKEADADLFLHCGDICVDEFTYPQILTVCGNNDYYDYPMQRIIDVEGHRIIMFHSHQFSFLKREERMIQRASENDCDIICFGHTHVALDEVKEGVHIINPGSLYHSRDGRPISYAVLDISKEQVKSNIIFIENT